MNKSRGIAATGHLETSRAAALILEAGGNAFDAALAALCAACVAEPLLASLGGGGFLLAHETGGNQKVFDFFCQTPGRRRSMDEIDFYPIAADFGPVEQEFHIGMGAIAVPGVVAGLFAIHEELCTLPLREIVAPAVALAREGVIINAQQAYVIRILDPILRASPEAHEMYRSTVSEEQLLMTGERMVNRDLANVLETLSAGDRADGHALFYQGEWAELIARDCQANGGQLALGDLAGYRVERRDPVRFSYGDANCAINPFPSPGGCLVAFTLGMLDGRQSKSGHPKTRWGGDEHLSNLLHSLGAASRARTKYDLKAGLDGVKQSLMLDDETLKNWRNWRLDDNLFSRGTTHISVADAAGNLASLTISNGEGSAYILPGTGIMLNNMLGEEDINPAGLNCWTPGKRLASMMSPAVALRADGTRIALGSAGSNRIRSAIVQVLVNILDFDQSLEEAVSRPRIHLESARLSVEGGFESESEAFLCDQVAETHVWPDQNLFFGGVNAVSLDSSGTFSGSADPRRQGSVVSAGDR